MGREGDAGRLSRPEPTGRMTAVSDGGGRKQMTRVEPGGLGLGKGLPLSTLVLDSES